ncbi:conserved hypothetical protein [Microbacterium sp. 8M]|uniref:DUF6578 domain-containing protein n=1 Tax=Microbacterium sp. 8M TaxID=2653153 RepID=UPI0012F39683|nr:DUF6578 domain-containing protein [Microbacterium sp. 8M]VXB79502.1 conserved hypothetical protein [Microbacterium sp. 8M]
MSTVRVWLSGWEWACCGEPFAVGDAVSFTCRRPRDTRFVERFGAAFAESIDMVESHHDAGDDERPAQTIQGRVRAIHAVIVDERVVRVPRPPRPEPERLDLGNGVSAGAGPAPPYVLTSATTSGTVRLRREVRVPTAAGRDFSGAADPAPRPDSEDGAIVARSAGWVVDVEVR